MLGRFKFGGHAFICLAAVLWGTIGLVVRHLNDAGISAMQVVFLRALVTVLVLVPLLLIFNRNVFTIKLRDIWCFIGTGIISIVCFTYFNFYTLSIASMSFAAVMMYTAPIFLVIMSAILFKEKITPKKVIACVIAFLGTAFTAGVFGNVNAGLTAILTGVASGFFYALYSVFCRYAINRGYSSVTITVYTFIFALIGSAPFINFGDTFGSITAHPNSVWFLIIIAVFNTIIPYFTYNIGLKNTETGVALIIATLEPVTATVLGFIIYNEALTSVSVIGILLVILSVVLLNFRIIKDCSGSD